MLNEQPDIPNQLPGEKVYVAAPGTLVKVSVSLASPADQDFAAASEISISVNATPVGADGLVLQDAGLPMEPPSRTVTIPLAGSSETDIQSELDQAIEAAVEETAIWTARLTSLRQALAPWVTL